MHISIVSPVYLAENTVEKLVNEICEHTSQVTKDFEIILVEDGSPDNSWENIVKITNENKKVKALKLSRNFGQHYAITAGLEMAKGEWIVVMDCDLQDRPAEITNLYNALDDNTDILLARRKNRNDRSTKKLSSKLYYSVLGYLTDTKQDPAVANFGFYRRNVIEAVLQMGDYYRFLPTMIQWVGFNVNYLDVQHDAREEGRSSYSWFKLLKLGLNNIISFSDKPLRLTIRLGIMVILFALAFGCITLFQYFSGQITELGYASLILSIWFLSGIIIFTLGVIGLYISKSFDTVKNRPRYIIQTKIDNDES